MRSRWRIRVVRMCCFLYGCRALGCFHAQQPVRQRLHEILYGFASNLQDCLKPLFQLAYRFQPQSLGDIGHLHPSLSENKSSCFPPAIEASVISNRILRNYTCGTILLKGGFCQSSFG